MPRSRERLQLKRQAAAHHQLQADRRYQQQVLARDTEEPIQPTPTTSEAPEQDDTFDIARWDLNTRAANLLKQHYGTSWYQSPRLQRLAERVLQDLQGLGDGKALHHLRTARQRGGTYQLANSWKYGDE